MPEVELIIIDGIVVPHDVIQISGDGACLFYSLSYSIHGSVSHAAQVRAQIVNHVKNNWRRLKPFTMTPQMVPYTKKPQYLSEMAKPHTYGTSCELRVAGEIFPYHFEVYRGGALLATYGEDTRAVKRLRFTGDFTAGHFDVLIPMVQQTHTALPAPTTPDKVMDCHASGSYSLSTQPEYHPKAQTQFALSTDSDKSVPKLPSIAPERKGKKRRKRFTDSIRKKQVRDAVSTYAQNNPDVNRKAVDENTKANPKVHRKAVDKYTKANPEVHRKAVDKYTKTNPEVNRKAVDKYTKVNPEVNRKAVDKYTKANPEVNRMAVNKYTKNNPQNNLAAVINYNEKRAQIALLPWTALKLSAFKYDPNTDYAQTKTVDIGSQVVCSFCHAKKWKDESPGMCCKNGKVQLPSIQQYPEPLHSLLNHQHPLSEHFLTNIRKYNGCFQMTSFGAKEVREGNFMPTFKVQGQVYHRIGSLMPEIQHQPAFLQIYFLGDGSYERDIRCKNFPGVNPELVKELQDMLHHHNKYIQDFKTAMESVPKDQVVINADRKPTDAHRGRFNAPTTKEVAILIVGQEFERRDIVLHSRDSSLVRISETHRSYDTLQYPLMFCRGEDGYYTTISQHDPSTKVPLKKTVSAADFYSYSIMERDGKESYILLFRNLLNQFLVDMYAKIETERLNWIRFNQKKLRSEEYAHLKDAISKADGQLLELGKMVVLPSSFTGGPRYMHERTQDALTYVRQFGRPDLFITFTCNPKWTDITLLLKQYQKPHDRHDIIARVFHLKVKKIMKLLTQGCVFGNTRCHMYSVEWQKRGLPHVHILLWLEEKIRPESIDKVISAEIPDPQLDPILHHIVKTTMIHGPCGSLNRNSLCMAEGMCTKKYPRPLLKETQTGEDSYPKYRRRSPADGGFTTNVNGVDIDNRWVVPYNPVLSRTFSAHINVEFCNSVKSIKYICKYVNKGSDQASFTVTELDEVTRYETGRYISSSEAAWRILCFPIHERFPPVMHLAVHLENGQRVYFTEENVFESIRNPPKTTLTAFFELCKVDSFAKTLLYNEVASYYVWKGNTFCRRKQGKAVPGYPGVKKDHVLGRVYTIHPGNSECFYLRLLLHQIRGPVSFTSLRNVAGVVHPTFQAACRALGLLEDDAHWDCTLAEASISDSPQKIRELFSVMLVFCQLGDPIKLWENHRECLAEDLIIQIERESGGAQLVMEVVYNDCLVLLEDIVMATSGHPLQHYGLPSPIREQRAVVTNRIFVRESAYNTIHLSEVVTNNIIKLNKEQKKAYDEIMYSIDSHSGGLFFLDAPGGTGKTFLINLLLATVRSTGNIAIAVASSGIAATLLDGGKTAHSAFKLPFNFNCCESAICNISKQSEMAQVLRNTKLIVWDECTMAHKGAVEALDRTLQDIRNHNQIMGGVTVLLAGDFRQTLPVVSRGTQADEVKACLKSSILWPKVKVLSLKMNMRVHLQGDLRAEEFSKLLLNIGDGKLEEKEGKINIPDNLCSVVEDHISLIDQVYPDICQTQSHDASWLKERAILTPTNDSAISINLNLLEKLSTEKIKYESVDSVVDFEDAVHYPVEFLHTLNPPGLPPHILLLKIGAPIMLLRNLNPPKLCNGTRLQVTALFRHVIEATIFTGIGQGETVFIPRIPLIPTDYQVQFKRLQFPIALCYAMTINKAQGQSLKVAGIDLRSDCFSHGQLYVACSRVSSPDSLVILQPERKTRNLVYREVLTIE